MDVSRRTRAIVGASALMLCASVALADELISFPECKVTAPSAQDVEAAKQSHIIATSRFNLKDYDKAIEFWRQAYGLDCTAHALLVNIANAYEQKGDKQNAIIALETYLTRAKDAPDLVAVNERVVDLKKSMGPTPPPTTTAPATATTTEPLPTGTTTAPETPVGPRPFGYTPLIMAGAGGALAIIGAILIPVGLGPYNDALVACPVQQDGSRPCPEPIADSGNVGRVTWNLGGAMVGIGAVAAIGGLGWHFLFNKPAPVAAPATTTGSPDATISKLKIRVTPAVSPEVGGLIVTGQF